MQWNAIHHEEDSVKLNWIFERKRPAYIPSRLSYFVMSCVSSISSSPSCILFTSTVICSQILQPLYLNLKVSARYSRVYTDAVNKSECTVSELLIFWLSTTRLPFERYFLLREGKLKGLRDKHTTGVPIHKNDEQWSSQGIELKRRLANDFNVEIVEEK